MCCVNGLQTVPEYDVLVTNPPFSDEHKEDILRFALSSARPWWEDGWMDQHTTEWHVRVSCLSVCLSTSFLLLPNYVATKGYFRELQHGLDPLQRGFFAVPPLKYITPHHSHTHSSTHVCVCVCVHRYEYSHPENTGHASSPFFSIWFVTAGRQSSNDTSDATSLYHRWVHHLRQGGGPVGMALVWTVEELQRRHVVRDGNRPNPKKRRKMKARCVETEGVPTSEPQRPSGGKNTARRKAGAQAQRARVAPSG